jgi:hypothetical protein
MSILLLVLEGLVIGAHLTFWALMSLPVLAITLALSLLVDVPTLTLLPFVAGVELVGLAVLAVRLRKRDLLRLRSRYDDPRPGGFSCTSL